MSDPIGAAVLVEKKSAFEDYYRWEEPARDITVCLNLEAANRLQAEVLGSDGSSHEIGGILLGRRERERGRTVTVIEDFDLVPCEHRDGPLYSLSASDLQEFQTALTRRKSNGNLGNSVVGYCRSHKREDLFLSADDLAVIRTRFADPDDIILIIKAMSGKVCTAGFFFWDNGQIQPEFTDSEVALIPIEGSDFGPDPDVPDLHEEEPPALLLPGARRSEATGWRPWVIGAFALSAITGGAIFGILDHRGQQSALRPESPRQVVATKLPDSPQAAKDESAAEPPAVHQVPSAPKTAAIHSDAAGEPRAERPTSAREEPASEGTKVSPVLSTPLLPGTVVATAPPPVAPPAAPSLIEKAPASPAIEQQPPQPVLTTPAVPTPVAQTPPQQPPPVAPKPQPVETSFVGPQIIHQVAPAIPLGVGQRITANIQIDVTVTINESGKVAGARVSSQSGAGAGLLALEALKAAQLFRFRPARENNRPVRSDMVLTFRFAPKAQ
jgi:TonB family protein